MVSVFVTVDVQPLAFVTVTVYVPAVLRFSDAVEAPVFHKYLFHPVAVQIVVEPGTTFVFAFYFGIGFGCTFTMIDFVPEHPSVSVTVTV